MADWKLFYKILGFDSTNIDPENLLHLQHNNYSKADVLNAFETAKQKLRNSIGDSKLVPEMIKFEKTVLESALYQLISNASNIENDKDLLDDTKISQELETMIFEDESLQNPDSTSQQLMSNLEDDNFEELEMFDTSLNSKRIIKYCLLSLALLIVIIMLSMAFNLSKRIDDLKKSRDLLAIINYDAKPEDDIFLKIKTFDVKSFIDSKFKTNLSKDRQLLLTEAEYFRLDPDSPLDNKQSLDKTASALISCCDRISKIGNNYDSLSHQLELINFQRKVEKDSISVCLQNLQIQNNSHSSYKSSLVDQLEKQLYEKDETKKHIAIERLAEIDTNTSREILLEKLRKICTGTENWTITNHLLIKLSSLSDASIKTELAYMTAQCPRPTVASQIIINLKLSTNIDPAKEGILPLKNDHTARQACSKWWLSRLSKQNPINNPAKISSDPNSPTIIPQTTPPAPSATIPDLAPEVDKLATISIFTEMLANELKTFNWTPQDQMQTALIQNNHIIINEIEDKIKTQSSSIVSELLRIARENPDSKDYYVKLDIIDLERRTRILASQNYIQQAIVNFQAATQILDIINLEIDRYQLYDKLLETLIEQRKIMYKYPKNSFQQLQQSTYYLLRSLDLFYQQVDENNLNWQES